MLIALTVLTICSSGGPVVAVFAVFKPLLVWGNTGSNSILQTKALKLNFWFADVDHVKKNRK